MVRRRFAQTVVSARGDMALMRKARKDALQADVAQHLWQAYLQHLDTAHPQKSGF